MMTNYKMDAAYPYAVATDPPPPQQAVETPKKVSTPVNFKFKERRRKKKKEERRKMATPTRPPIPPLINVGQIELEGIHNLEAERRRRLLEERRRQNEEER